MYPLFLILALFFNCWLMFGVVPLADYFIFSATIVMNSIIILLILYRLDNPVNMEIKRPGLVYCLSNEELLRSIVSLLSGLGALCAMVSIVYFVNEVGKQPTAQLKSPVFMALFLLINFMAIYVSVSVMHILRMHIPDMSLSGRPKADDGGKQNFDDNQEKLVIKSTNKKIKMKLED